MFLLVILGGSQVFILQIDLFCNIEYMFGENLIESIRLVVQFFSYGYGMDYLCQEVVGLKLDFRIVFSISRRYDEIFCV